MVEIDRTINDMNQDIRDLNEFKKKLEYDRDEEENAVRMYAEHINMANKVGLPDAAAKIRTIQSQERNHAEIFKKLIRDIENTERKLLTTKQQLEEQKRKSLQVKESQMRYVRR